MASKYRWIITKDHLNEGDDVGTMGPSNCDEDLVSNSTHFSMYDDDMECYYEGMLYGDFEGFEPLDDYGTPNAGAVHIKINGEFI